MADQIDTSIYTPPQNNTINMLSSVAGIQNQLNSARLFQQEFSGRLALGKLYSQAPLDANGNPDQRWIQRNAGRAGIMAPEATQQALQGQAQQLAIQSQQLQNQKTKASIGAASLLPLANKPEATASDLVDTANDLMQRGLLSPEEHHAMTMALASHLKTGTPQTFAKALTGRFIAMGGNPEFGQKLLAGEPTTVQTNQGIQPGTRDISSGAFTPAGAQIPLGLPPTTPVYKGESGRAQFAQQPGVAPNPFMNPGAPGNVPGGNAPTGAEPQAPNVPNAPSAPSVGKSPTPTSNDTTLYAEPPPAYTKQLEPALDRVNTVIQRGNDAVKIVPSLQGVLQYADSGGPAQETYNKAVGLLKDSPLGRLFDPNTDKQARFEILNKFASDVSGQNMSANARNELESEVQSLSNPNATQFPKALRTVAKFLLGRTAAAKAQADYMTPYVSDPNVQPKDIVHAEKDWRENFDQNIFELPYMTPDERKNLIGGLDDNEYKKFKKHAGFMLKQGLVNPDDL